jgi:ubiquinone/menaquinone biosynthesis C-methylase UbiE
LEETMGEYALRNSWSAAGRRLQAIEGTYDAGTRRRLTALGVGPGWDCLEVGAGGGSVARWLARRVGPDGTVLAVDIDVSPLGLTDADTILEVRQADIRTDALPVAEFDLVHARLVLSHIPDYGPVLDKLVAAVRPGGWLFLEEGDMFATGTLDDGIHAQMMAALRDALKAVGGEVDFGRKLPSLLRDHALRDIGVDCVVPMSEGGSSGTEFLRLTYDQMSERGVLIDAATAARWKEMTSEPGRWFPGLGLIGAWGRTPGALRF